MEMVPGLLGCSSGVRVGGETTPAFAAAAAAAADRGCSCEGRSQILEIDISLRFVKGFIFKYTSVCICTYGCPRKPEEGIGAPGAGVIGSSESPNVSLGN